MQLIAIMEYLTVEQTMINDFDLRQYRIIIILGLMISLPIAFSGCWTYNGECTDSCFDGYVSINNQYYSSASDLSCMVESSRPAPIGQVYHFDGKTKCELNQAGGPCYYKGVGSQTVYSMGASSSCSACEGVLRCINFNGIGSGCETVAGLVCRRGNIFTEGAGCFNKVGASCSNITTSTVCNAHSSTWLETHLTLGCSWNEKNSYAFAPKIVYNDAPECVYAATKCPEPTHKLDPNTNDCVVPQCPNIFDCVTEFGPGFICQNPGEWDAKCVADPNFTFEFDVSKTIDETEYVFQGRLDFNWNPWLDVLRKSTGQWEYYGLKANQQFILGNKSYSSVFELPKYYFALYSASLTKRLTYNIFPVCGNGVCEVCESEDNCLSYPPESCLSCPADCPYVSFADLREYNNNNSNSQLSFASVSNNPDNACKVKTGYSESSCNPLCLTHDFIDEMGCIFNLYSNALPNDDFDELFEKNKSEIPGYEFEILKLEDDFYGANNSLCSNDCECLSSNCVGTELSDKHCCRLGYTWKEEDSKNEFCDNGRMKDDIRKLYEDYDEFGRIKSTKEIRQLANGEIEVISAQMATDAICVDKLGLTNKLSCSDGYDPFCVYGNPNVAGDYSPIKPNGEGQCRIETFETPQVINNLQCTIATNAWALAGCAEKGTLGTCRGWTGNIPMNTYFCVTNNPLECASYNSIKEIVGNSGPVLRSISYEEFCHNPGLVCAGDKFITQTNALEGVGMIDYVNCPQDAFGAEIVNFYKSDSFFSGGWNSADPKPMAIGFYCSLFGNDIDNILAINKGNLYGLSENDIEGTDSFLKSKYSPELIIRSTVSTAAPSFFYGGEFGKLGEDGETVYYRATALPKIDRDAQESLYNSLWNYESCIKVYPDIKWTCKSKEEEGVFNRFDNILWTKDSLVPSYPSFHHLGIYPQIYSSNNYFTSNYKDIMSNQYYPKKENIELSVVSKAFCDILWQEYESKHGAYDGNTFSELTINGISYDGERVKSFIYQTCRYWYTPIRDIYYSDADSEEYGNIIMSPIHNWKNYIYSTQSGMIPKDDLDIDYFRDPSYCSALGTIMANQKCSSIYPVNIGEKWRTCDCVYSPVENTNSIYKYNASNIPSVGCW